MFAWRESREPLPCKAMACPGGQGPMQAQTQVFHLLMCFDVLSAKHLKTSIACRSRPRHRLSKLRHLSACLLVLLRCGVVRCYS
jgi:hypothetical protein